jgi:hypothetical protein
VFLKKLGVNYQMEVLRNEDNNEIDTQFVIQEMTPEQEQSGQYAALNRFASTSLAAGRYVIVLNPFDLVRKEQGTVRMTEDALAYYSMSLNLFVNLAHLYKIYQPEAIDYSADPELQGIQDSVKDKPNTTAAPDFATLLQRRGNRTRSQAPFHP